MKAILITKKLEVKEVKLEGPYVGPDLDEYVGGWWEIVRGLHMAPTGVVMVVNENGLNMGLPINAIGSLLYGTPKHGSPIVGDVLLLYEGFTDDGPDFVEMPHSVFMECLTMLTKLGGNLENKLMLMLKEEKR